MLLCLKASLKVLTRAQLDARNNEDRPATVWEIVAQNFNDERFVVYTESHPDLHSTFADVMELKFKDMPGGAITPEDAKKKFGDARAKLIQVSV